MDHSSGIRLPDDARLDKKRKINNVIICIHYRDVSVKFFMSSEILSYHNFCLSEI